MQHMTKEQRAVRDADFERRMQPRVLWPSQQYGTARRSEMAKDGYTAYQRPAKRKAVLTEAQDNAIGRKLRRRTNKSLRGWRPHAQR